MQVWIPKTWKPLKFETEIPKTQLLSQKSQHMCTFAKKYHNICALGVSKIISYAYVCRKNHKKKDFIKSLRFFHKIQSFLSDGFPEKHIFSQSQTGHSGAAGWSAFLFLPNLFSSSSCFSSCFAIIIASSALFLFSRRAKLFSFFLF